MDDNGIGVLVVDDHEIVRRGLVSTLTPARDIRILGEATSGEEAIRKARELHPDVVLMDLRMPGIGGLEAAKRISSSLAGTRIVAFTEWDSEPPARLRRNGIVACVGKQARTADLEAVIRRVAAMRERERQCAVAEPAAHSANPFDDLTSREMQIATMRVEGITVAQIARTLHIDAKTVHTYRYRIFEKLGVGGDVELTRLAAQWGIIGPGPQP